LNLPRRRSLFLPSIWYAGAAKVESVEEWNPTIKEHDDGKRKQRPKERQEKQEAEEGSEKAGQQIEQELTAC
jgi:hypothetical protein